MFDFSSCCCSYIYWDGFVSVVKFKWFELFFSDIVCFIVLLEYYWFVFMELISMVNEIVIFGLVMFDVIEIVIIIAIIDKIVQMGKY